MSPTSLATGGGKALPIMRHANVFLLPNCQSSGNPCRRAIIRGVSRGMPSKSLSGASLAILLPSTPISAHAIRARVGPRSGPPCFLLPPTRVGATLFAICLHCAALDHPLADIRSYRELPTSCISLGFGKGKVNESNMSVRMPTITARGRSCGTPKSEAFSKLIWTL